MDSADLKSVKTSLSKSSFQSVNVDIGSTSKDRLAGDSAGNEIFGLLGNDQLDGKAGNDKLFGCYSEVGGGRNEIDQLTGGAGKDTFVLGVDSGVLYNDGNNKNRGVKDYVVVKDFTAGQDKLQLKGNKSDYFLGASPISGEKGQGLFYDSNNNSKLDSTDELIGLLQGSKLSASNTINNAIFV
jgi:Ca2+-binding RTX toxin-like protein